ncbi:thioesterase family protein [Thalassococcus sp. S3]|uniref:acyl-CoA thioesterase n=1 Tax=Thalassococcus sp. S3 TaxID=2017482 RepID=UPI001024446A|nr:thioesterase family protein [Thalassococcus sp. S3]QBF33863.1 thioesterase [Thalassococcus sp. S3]
MSPAQGAFCHEIRVTWGDCDPAKIAYTARLPWFALDAINAWWEHHLGGHGWYQLELDDNIGTPFVHMSMDFRAPVTPRHRLICETWPSKLGTSSIEFSMKGWQDGVLCFEGRFVCVFTIADQFKSQPAPRHIREVVEPLVRAPVAAQ